MLKADYDLELDRVSPSIYNTQRRQDNTDTREASETGTAKPASINGLKKEVMTSDAYTRMTQSTTVPETNINLSREELLKLLSVFEGELQARDEVIEILKSERPNNPAITDRYGLSNMPLQALQRDAASLDATTKDHVAEQTTQNLQKINLQQKESCKKLKQALLAAEQLNQRLVVEVTEEKRKHQDYMIKSDDFVNLLEEERERLKFGLQKEKQISESRELEISRKLRSNKDELAKLKSLSLVLVEERQQQVSELSEQKQQIADLERRLKEAEIKWKESELDINTEKEHAMQLENDLEGQTDQFFQNQEDFNTKLEEEMEKNAQLEEKVASMSLQLKKLQSVQRNLQKTDDQLWRIHEKLEQEDEEHDLLLEEVELLRQRVKDMEDGEKIYTQAQEESKDIRQKLEEEITLTRNLRSQLKTLQTQVKAQRDLEKSIEDTDFRFDELQLKFEFEKRKSNDMKEHLQKMKARMTELDQYEKLIQESEEKINKMKEKIILLNGEKKCCGEQVKFLIDKTNQLKNEMKTEKDKVTEITEKLIGESRKVLKLREELSQRNQEYSTMQDKRKEAEEKIKELSSNKQTQAEEANDRLRRQVIMLKTRLDQLEKETEAKPKKTSLPQSMGLVDVVQKLKETEQRCEQLSQELHTKTKLCENLKKNRAQGNQSNNNSKLRSVTVAVTQTESNDILTAQASKKKAKQSGISKVAAAKNMFGADPPILSSRKAASLPPQGTSLLTRGSKVGPTFFQVNRKKPTMADSSKPQADELRETKYLKEAPITNTATSRMTKNGKNGAPVIEQENEPHVQNPSTVPLGTRNGKVAPVDCSPTKRLTETDDRVQSVAEVTKLAKNVSSIKGTMVKTTRQSRAGDQVIKRREEFETQKAATPIARGGKVVPAGLTVPQKPATATEIFKLTKKEHTSNSKITKITKDVQSAAPVEELDESQTHNLTSKSPKSLTFHNGNNKELNVTNQDSKISKHNAPLKHFRTFQAQKDFTELQRKWAAKLGK